MSDTRSYNLTEKGVALEGYSPVSYFEKEEAEVGKVVYSVTVRGAIYYLTSTVQMEQFRAFPSKFEPAFGGWCAYHMTLGRKHQIDPTCFRIVRGRLFLFCKTAEVDGLESWDRGDETDYVSRAHQHWESLHPIKTGKGAFA